MPYGSNIPMKHAGRYMEQFVQVVVPKGSQGATRNGMAGIGGYNGGTGTMWKSTSNHGTSNSGKNTSSWNAAPNKK